MSEQIDQREYDELERALALAQHTVYKRYLSELYSYPIVDPTAVLTDLKPEECVRLFQLKELTHKQGEDIFQKLTTVYHASMALGCNLIVLVDVERINAPTKIYIGVRNNGDDLGKLGTSFRTLKNGLKSNFPGSILQDISAKSELPDLLDKMFGESVKYISTVTCVAAERDKTNTKNKDFVQGLERFIDAMVGNTYTAVFIAEPVNDSEQAAIRDGYEKLYSTISPFCKSVWSYNENESKAVMESLSTGISKSITDGTSKTSANTVNVGMNIGVNSGSSEFFSTASSKLSKAAKAARVVGAVGGIASKAAPALTLICPPAAAVAGVVSVAGRLAKTGSGIASTILDETITVTTGESKYRGMSGGLNAGYAHTSASTVSHSETNTTTETKTSGTTDTKGEGRTLQIEKTNKAIEEMLQRIESQLKRTKSGEDYGAYSCGAYFLASRQEGSLLAANTYQALMLGEGTSVERGAINIWSAHDNPEIVETMKQYLQRFEHPIFAMPVSDEVEPECILYTPGTIVSGLELPLHMGIPTRSVYGLPILEHAEFGRNVTERVSYMQNDKKINLGKLYHMGQVEEQNEVCLDLQGLASHTFVTGSTGSGKSNTIYMMLERLQEQQVKFLVIEPAKGEYKSVFGHREDVTVYGTNPKLSDVGLLRVNPFSFPAGVHVLEHMDRLVEIFNVCWPMYAAMPAVLKEAVERAYTAAGWDLLASKNRWDDRIFPSFGDVLRQIREVLAESDYSSDSKGDYTGALVTRVRSLTNGINGLIFTPDEIDASQLFDKNVIVDLSRVGSTETKALLMGILILKLQEYRMESHEANASLCHVTVLEEAHNLLRRTSAEQMSEGVNLLGKSVEMLSNSIAEMRTYGEGFVIADQSPGLLDMSVIRNTNTKIILRLPDYTDRELVGRAAGLNDEQIVELERLERGVAAVNQSGWLEPVLCQVGRHEAKPEDVSEAIDNMVYIRSVSDTQKLLLDSIMKRIADKNAYLDIKKLQEYVLRCELNAVVKYDFMEYFAASDLEAPGILRKLVYDFLRAEDAVKKAEKCNDVSQWAKKVAENLNPSIGGYSTHLNKTLSMILREQASRDVEYSDVYRSFAECYKVNGGVL